MHLRHWLGGPRRADVLHAEPRSADQLRESPPALRRPPGTTPTHGRRALRVVSDLSIRSDYQDDLFDPYLLDCAWDDLEEVGIASHPALTVTKPVWQRLP